MTPSEAAKLLELPVDSTPEKLEARFLELRARLEDKIAKAPTPGLKEKYRASLTDITAAFEILTLAADSGSLPVRERTSPAPAPTAAPGRSAPAAPAPDAARSSVAPGKASSSREFIVVALIAVLVLGGGGWWVVKTRAEAAERARQEAAAKVEQARQEAAAKAELARQEAATKAEAERLAAEQRRLEAEAKAREEAELGRLRATQAELKIRWETIERKATSAEHRLSELKGDARAADRLSAAEQAELKARLAAQTDYVEWLQAHVERHAAKTQLARLEALLSARALADAATTAQELAAGLDASEREGEAQKTARLTMGRTVKIESAPAGLHFTGQDAYGRGLEGTTPYAGELPWGPARVTVEPPGTDWVAIQQTLQVTHEQEPVLRAEFASVPVSIVSSPSGVSFELTTATGSTRSGKTPAKLEDIPTGTVKLLVKRPGWPNVIIGKTVKATGENVLNVEHKLTAAQESAVNFLKGTTWVTPESGWDVGEYTIYSTHKITINRDLSIVYTRTAKTRSHSDGEYFSFETRTQSGVVQFDDSNPRVIQIPLGAGVNKQTHPDKEEPVPAELKELELSKDGLFLEGKSGKYSKVTE
jgi:chemotaxis protein histidine kinase CheA